MLEILLRVRDALTPLLIAVMVMGIAAAVIALCREQRFLTGPLGRFRALTPMGRVAVVVLLCLLTRWAGSKPEGASPSGSTKASSSPLPRHSEPTQDNAGNSPVSNLVVTAFKVEGQGVSFETAWPGDLLDRALSRDIHLFASTNLLERKWTCLCAVPLPSHTNSFTFTVTANDVAASVRQRFLDTFGGRGFYTFVLDFDSDGDGLRDVEELDLGLNPLDAFDAMADPDGDGIPTLYEVRNGTDPLVPDWDLAPKTVVGENGVATLRQALAESEAYAIVVLPPGVHEGPGWTGLTLPPHPVMVTSANSGYEWGTILRHRSSPFWSAFILDDVRSSFSVFQGFTIDMASSRKGFNAGFWCGGRIPFSGGGVSAFFHNLYVRLPPTDEINVGFFCRHAPASRTGFAGCVVNANGAECARGIYIVDGAPALVENCSFLNFPASPARAGYGIQLESSALNWGNAPDPVPVEISNCLFDLSFTNATPLAILDPGVKYGVALHHSLMPCPPTNGVSASAMLYTNAVVGVSGLLAADSPARGSGAPSRLAFTDARGVARGASPDIGAYQYAQVETGGADADGDGISDYDELVVYNTDPLLSDTDGDGEDDADELFVFHTDPCSRASFHACVTVTVLYAHTALPGVTNYICHGSSPTGWEGDGQAHTTTNAVFRYAFTSRNEQVYVKLFADLNRNGVYDADADWLRGERVAFRQGAGEVTFTVGDMDGDGQGDLFEFEHGCDPLSNTSFHVHVAVAVNYRFSALPGVTNYVCHSSSPTGWEGDGQASTTTNVVFQYVFPSLDGQVYVKLFTDVNANGVYDAGGDPLQCVQVMIGDAPAEVVFDVGDMDGDGQGDAYEVANGSDPLDRRTMFVRVRAEVSNADTAYAFVTNYVSYGFRDRGWETNGLNRFTGTDYACDYGFVTTNGQAYVNVLRDFNGNGLYDEGSDALCRRRVTVVSNRVCAVSVLLGDADGDGVPDSAEDADGTGKFDAGNFRREVSVRLSEAFKGACYISMALATNIAGRVVPVSEIVPVTNGEMSVAFAGLTLTNVRDLYLVFFDDVNINGVRDAGEAMADCKVPTTGRGVQMELEMPRGPFDSDGDGLPDWRERVLGLDPADPSDAFRDDDGDGLVNLHECWTGCDPFTPDGTNSLLAVMAKSIDDRIAGREPAISLPLYSNYESAGSAYDLAENTNCWAYGIDFSCCSMWNDIAIGGGHQHAVTAISPRHVVMANHFNTPLNTMYFFKGTNGFFYSSRLVRKVRILNTDIAIGLLDTPLPSSVVPARILPIGFERYIGTGKGLPVITLDQEEKSLVMELSDLPVGRHPDDLDKANAKCQIAHTAERQGFFEEVIDGDSSNPRFLVVGNELVLLCTMYKGWYGYGPLLTLYAGEIQAAMDYLSPDDHYELQEYDFSNYDQLPSMWEDL